MNDVVMYQEALRAALARLMERVEEPGPADSAEGNIRAGVAQAVEMLLHDLEAYGVNLSDVGMAGVEPIMRVGAGHKKAA